LQLAAMQTNKKKIKNKTICEGCSELWHGHFLYWSHANSLFRVHI